jgi:hypothetical protein
MQTLYYVKEEIVVLGIEPEVFDLKASLHYSLQIIHPQVERMCRVYTEKLTRGNHASIAADHPDRGGPPRIQPVVLNPGTDALANEPPHDARMNESAKYFREVSSAFLPFLVCLR